MYYGGDYYPEQWPEEVWLEDVRLMKKAGVNLVSLGVFAWAKIQPREAEFDFEWLDRILALLAENEIGVNLATATASPPPWAIRNYPDMLPVTEDGTVLFPGSRQHYAPTSPDYRRLAGELVRRITQRYADHPAVKMWHVNNEYACHVPYDYSIHAGRAFRAWLRTRYTTIEALNAAWGTAFWAQSFTDFDEVEVPRLAPTSRNPAGLLDFRRFTSDAVLDLYKMERDIIRAAGAEQPITTNFMGAYAPVNYWNWADEVDVIADDSYPDPRDPAAFRGAAFTRDLMRSLKPNQPWILMEQSSNGVNWRPNNKLKSPGQMAALSEQAVARGAGGIMFFQWRQSTAGSEKFHSGMLPHSGTETRTWREVVALGQSLADREPTVVPPAEAAVILDWENGWAIDQPDHPARFDYLEQVREWYDALHAAHIQADIVHPAHDLSGYRLVVAPALYLISEAGAASLTRFVADGGVLVTTPFTDLVDETDRFLPGGYATRLGKVFGGRVIDFDGVMPEDGLTGTLQGVPFRADIMREEFELGSGSIAATLDDGWPALIDNTYGLGRSFHTTVFVNAPAVSRLLETAIDAAGIKPVVSDLPDTVEAIRTQSSVVLINHSRETATVTGAGFALEIGGFGVVIQDAPEPNL
jgi:beta-galactosidase